MYLSSHFKKIMQCLHFFFNATSTMIILVVFNDMITFIQKINILNTHITDEK